MEPSLLEPTEHEAILYAVLRDLVGDIPQPLDRFDCTTIPRAREFDLVTFPEAFTTTQTLLDLAKALATTGVHGCLHMGLRPDTTKSHLFSLPQLQELLVGLQEIANPELGDLKEFSEWLARQQTGPFNVGCVLSVDPDGNLRVCLHPKIVRSKFEADGLPTQHMVEADLLTLITLVPVRKEFGTVTLQPLICSDALNLETDRRVVPPIIAVNRHADCIPEPPNHVDIVSVATCTPQPGAQTAKHVAYRAWHSQFLEAFKAAAESPDCGRHHFSVFILANYAEIDKGRTQGGLSGAFLPIPPGPHQFISGVTTSCWGKPKNHSRPNNGWSIPDDDALACWSNRAFIVCLEPTNPDLAAMARVMDFDVDRLPRECSLWRKAAGVTSMQIHVCVFDESNTMHLQHETMTDA
ncbi:MAG: hypothetical protein ABF739_08260 [Acetobacter okinawensis]